MQTKIIFRLFTIADFEQEELFLRKQHQKGYRLSRYIVPGLYIFKACQPEDVIYRLDFASNKSEEKPYYLQMFNDYGWEYLFDACGWSYFRKANEAGIEDLSLFSDTSSKIAMLQRLFKQRMIPLLIIFACCILPQLVYSGNAVLTGGHHPSSHPLSLLVIYAVLFFLYLWVFARYSYSLVKLKRKHLSKETI